MKFYNFIIFLALFFVVDARPGQEEKNPNLKVLEKKFKVGDGDIEGFFGDIEGAFIDCKLIAASPCCAQNQADKLVDVAYFLGDHKKEDKKKQLIELAINLMLSEKNTPNKCQRAAICDQKPRHKELDGLAKKMKQDPCSKRNSKPFEKKDGFEDPKNFVLKLHGDIIAPNCKRFPARDDKAKCSTKK
ncbi:23920_t:CDS:2 [Dentiscutata erythropus]|uniref:23920_t:CDS:1 n=1 Tax=Dentiscutata erythropus TaxID=1348616 RepID=A0A9N9ADX2_9GLOM|nr:23920_t:CDS:2 [Dentiscutata erythropus]